MALVSAPGQNREKKVFCHDLPPAGGLWWAGPRVERCEMRVVEEQRTLAFQSAMGLVSLEKQRPKICFKNCPVSQVKLTAVT